MNTDADTPTIEQSTFDRAVAVLLEIAEDTDNEARDRYDAASLLLTEARMPGQGHLAALVADAGRRPE